MESSIKYTSKYTQLEEQHEKLKKEYENLKKEYQENVIITSMNEMKSLYNELETKLKNLEYNNTILNTKNKNLKFKSDKLTDIIYNITNHLKTIKLLNEIISNKPVNYTLKSKLSLINDVIDNCISLKNDVYLL